MIRATGISVLEFVEATIDDVTVTGGNIALVSPGTEHWQRAFELFRLVF